MNHPHIVAVHDFGQAGGQPYLVMKFVDGPNLRQVEQAGRLTPAQALEIVPQICEALQFAHNEGLVHRDIKPENILLDKKGRVKITDFGIAKMLGVPAGKVSLTGARDVVGTPHYMAPEQIEKPQTVDHRADIYSLGVVFYELLTGELPLGKFAPPSKKVQVDVRLDEVVLHALEKEPTLRYQHASEVQTDVETIAATQSQRGPARGDSPGVSDERPGWRSLALTGVRDGRRVVEWRGVAWVWGGLFSLMAAAIVLGWFASDKSFFLPAGLGAVLAVATVVTLFGVWFFSGLLGFLSKPPAPPSSLGVSPAESERIRREVKGPAIGLVVTGILNWLAIPLIVLVIAAVVSRSDAPNSYVLFVPLAALVLSSVMIVAGLKMKRLEAHGLAITGSILAILITPGNVIGLPIGIWALVVLSHREVRAAFGKNHPLPLPRTELPQSNRNGGVWKIAAVIAAAVMLLLAIPVGAILLAITIPSLHRAKARWQSEGNFMEIKTTNKVEPYQDVRFKDMSSIDLAAKRELPATFWFNQKTIWPASLPEGVNPQKLLSNAMNPGLGIHELHRDGLTGKGVNVAIIDQPLHQDHPEFAGKIAAYHDVGCESESSMHGPAVASLFVGNQCGIAPDARLYYVAAPSWTGDTEFQAKALDWIIDQNTRLPAQEKIRVVSVSAAPSGSGSPFTKHREMWDAACERAEQAGLLVLDCTSHRGFIGTCSLDATEPESVAKCEPGFRRQRGNWRAGGRSLVLAPCSPRTTAEEYVKGEFGYQYCGDGGLSWSIPYAAGVLALGWQIRPDLGAAQMRELLFKSAHKASNGSLIINPPEFIRMVKTLP